MMLAKEFHQNGYIVLRNFYPAGMVEHYAQFIRNALEQKVDRVFNRFGFSVFDADCKEKVDALIASTATLSEADQHMLMGHFPIEVRLDESVRLLGQHMGQSQILKDILGAEALFMHMPPMPRFVPPGYAKAAVPPHQDVSYNRHMSDFVTVWHPLVNIDDQCGGLVMFEGSHGTEESEYVKAAAPESGEWLPGVDVSSYRRVQLSGLKPGDVVVLSSTILHASAANTSDRIRLSIDIRLFGDKQTSSKHHLNLSTMQLIERVAA